MLPVVDDAVGEENGPPVISVSPGLPPSRSRLDFARRGLLDVRRRSRQVEEGVPAALDIAGAGVEQSGGGWLELATIYLGKWGKRCD